MKALRVLLWVVALASVGVLACVAWVQYDKAARWAEDAREAREEADSALAHADSVTRENERWAAVADSLERAAEEEAERVREREMRERVRADSLSAEIVGMVPEGEIRDRVAAAVTELRQSYERRIDDLEGLLVLSLERSTALEVRALAAEEVAGYLTDALRATEAERDAYKRALEPGLRERIRQHLETAALAAITGVGIGIAIGILMGA